MKHTLTIIGFALGLMLAAGAANATTPIACQKSHPGALTKKCTDPTTGASVKVDANASASAVAAAIASQTQSQAQSQTSTNTNQNVNTAQGGNVTYNEAAQPKFTSSVNANVNIGLNATILQGVEHDNALKIADWLDRHSKPCAAMTVILKTPQGRRSGIMANCAD